LPLSNANAKANALKFHAQVGAKTCRNPELKTRSITESRETAT
jgi:hypothetical protein